MSNNLMGFLAFAELGLGTAFTFSLFSPLANNDWETTRKIMLFLKKTFNAIGLVVVVGGGLIAVFLPLLVKDGQMIPHMQGADVKIMDRFFRHREVDVS
ncbi:hypothetical protein [Latilactobacillus curvatus]|uniref:hypothetical protein n=1 Tax=Latilactobacillus curvatus TaxID=28038 RepID=UPI00223BC1F4|nr:hypothetical protein [Latilactobacillus curvatus]